MRGRMSDMRHAHQVVLIGSTLLASWLGMQLVHESGHILAAWLTGAKVTRVVLSPTTISRTDVANNIRPLAVAWAGPLFGVCIPLLLWLCAQSARAPGAFILRFFSGFCFIANGLYIGVGSFGYVGDCGEMLRYGSTLWQLWLFGAITAPIGLVLWHRQGNSFGFGSANGHVSHSVTYVTLAVCCSLLVIGFAVDGH
jgi:hypothetical protein